MDGRICEVGTPAVDQCLLYLMVISALCVCISHFIAISADIVCCRKQLINAVNRML